ncbi:MAG: response regulator [Acidimicrobiales bacterium]|jgi:DNA-binding NarL/FixJ family response regulator
MSIDVSTGAVGAAGVTAIRVLLVDDHEMVAGCLAAAVGAEPGLEVVGTAGSVAECLRLTRGLLPDVVVMDLRLSDNEGDADGLAATRRLRAMLPDVSVVMLTAHPDRHVAREALDAGCCGFVAKRGHLDELVAAIRAAADGSTWFPHEVVGPTPKSGTDVSAREHEVLTLMASGHSTRDIAEELGLSLHTTRNHIRNLMAKLGAHSRLDAVVVAARCGLVRVPDDP